MAYYIKANESQLRISICGWFTVRIDWGHLQRLLLRKWERLKWWNSCIIQGSALITFLTSLLFTRIQVQFHLLPSLQRWTVCFILFWKYICFCQGTQPIRAQKWNISFVTEQSLPSTLTLKISNNLVGGWRSTCLLISCHCAWDVRGWLWKKIESFFSSSFT